MTPAGEKAALATKRVRIGAASSTVASVEPISTPAATAASPPARAVVATEAISHGARPVTRTPSRSGPAGTSQDTAHDRAGSTVTPRATARASAPPGRGDAARRGRVDRQRGGEDEQGEQRVDAVARGEPGERALHGQAGDRRGEHGGEFGIGGQGLAGPGGRDGSDGTQAIMPGQSPPGAIRIVTE